MVALKGLFLYPTYINKGTPNEITNYDGDKAATDAGLDTLPSPHRDLNCWPGA